MYSNMCRNNYRHVIIEGLHIMFLLCVQQELCKLLVANCAIAIGVYLLEHSLQLLFALLELHAQVEATYPNPSPVAIHILAGLSSCVDTSPTTLANGSMPPVFALFVKIGWPNGIIGSKRHHRYEETKRHCRCPATSLQPCSPPHQPTHPPTQHL